MELFKTISVIKVLSGVVFLDEDQARRRAMSIESIGDGAYQILSEVHFKAGETIGFESLPKVFMSAVERIKSDGIDDRGADDDDDQGTDQNPFDMETLVMAMFDLEEDNREHFTERGAPRVNAVAEIAGFKVTAEQCREAWEEFNKP